MRKFNKVKRKIDKYAIPLEKMLDLGKEQHIRMLYLVNELVKNFNSIIDTRQRMEILKIRRIEESGKSEDVMREVVDNELTKVRRNLAVMDNYITEFIDSTDRQMKYNDEYVSKMTEAKDKFYESIKDSEIILEYKTKAEVIQNLDSKLEGLSRVSKDAKMIRREAEILKKDVDTLQKLGYQFLQEKSQIVDNLLNLNAQVRELSNFYKSLIDKQKDNVKTLDLWCENIEDFYKIISFFSEAKAKKKLSDGFSNIINYINILVEIYKGANDEKLSKNYVSIFIEYKTIFEKYKEINLNKSVELINKIKDEYFIQNRVTPMKEFTPYIDSVIKAMNNVFMSLLWFANFLKFYKDIKFNEKLNDFTPPREIDINKLASLSRSELSQNGGGGISNTGVIWGNFNNDMIKLIDNSIDTGTDNRTPMVTKIQKFIDSCIGDDLIKFNSYYLSANKTTRHNNLGYFKRENETSNEYTYYEFIPESKTFGKSIDKKIDISKKPNIKPDERSMPALIHVKDNLYLYYPGNKLQFHSPGSELKASAKLYMFFCYALNSDSLEHVNERSNVCLLDIYTGYPIIKPRRDHMSLLEGEFIYDAFFAKNKDKDVLTSFINDIATSILIKRYDSLQLVDQDYCDILDETKESFMSKFRDNVKDHSFTYAPHEAMFPFEQWNISKYRSIPITNEKDKNLDDFINNEIKTEKENAEKIDMDTIKKNINEINRSFITDTLFNPKFPISIDPIFKTFVTIDKVEELEAKIMDIVKNLLEGEKRSSSSKMKTMQQGRLSELKSSAFMDNLYLLKPAVQQIVLREATFNIFKEQSTKDIHLLEYDFYSTKEQRVHALNPELAFEISKVGDEQPNIKIMERLVGKISIQDRFDEYMKTNDDPDGKILQLNFSDILPALKKMSKQEFANFMNTNFLDEKRKYDIMLSNIFLGRLAYVSDAIKSDLSESWFTKNGFNDNGLSKFIANNIEIKRKNQKKQQNPVADDSALALVGGSTRTKKNYSKSSFTRKTAKLMMKIN